MTDDFRIDLAAFQGPLDLLLYLVQQEEVDIYEVPIARIADRFLAACQQNVDALDVDKAGEFLVMASHLLVLKSRALLPRDDPVDLEEIDPRLDLVKQLLEYREFKSVSAELEDRAKEQQRKQPVRITRPDRKVDPADEELEVDLFSLVSVFQRLLAEVGDDDESVHLPKERLPITHFVGRIFDQLLEMGGQVSFGDLIGAQRDRTYVIGAFLALLELLKLNKVRAVQDGIGEIQIQIRSDIAEQAAHGEAVDVEDTLDAPDIHEEARKGPRVVFMGSPDFAVPSLRALVGAGYAPVLVVTPPPQRAGRGRRLKPVPVAKAADDLQLPFHRTNDVNGKASMAEVEAAQPDVIITAGFGQILRKPILQLPPKGCLNVHASILPKYRGASPVAAAIRSGEKEIGVSIFRMTRGLDTGPVLAVRGMALGPEETTDVATQRLAEMAGDFLVKTLEAYLADEIEPQPQDDAESTYAGLLEKKDGVIDWRLDSQQVHDHIRAMTSWPGAQTAWQPRVKHDPLALVIVRAEVLIAPAAASTDDDGPRPGEIVTAGKEGIDVACAPGVVRVLEVRPAGGKVLKVRDFLNARPVRPGDRFVAPKIEQPTRSAR